MKSLRVLIAVCMLIAFGAVAASAQPIGRPDTPTLLKKVDSFAFVTDLSGSMMQGSANANDQKIVLAKRLMGLINDRIPALDYNAGLFTVCPVGTPVQAGAWNRLALGNAIAALPSNLAIFGRLTPLGADFSALQPALGNLRNGAVILVSDGYKNIGDDAVASIRAALQASGAKLHLISFADDVSDVRDAKRIMDGIAGLNSDPCYNGRELLFNPVALDAFIEHVFYKEATPVITETVFFDTAKFDLKPEAKATLDNAIVTINNAPRGVRTVEIEGYADAQGGVGVSNMILSIRRAEAVKEYLISKGVQADKVYSKGNNVSFKHNNSTAPGRHDNRRADLIIN